MPKKLGSPIDSSPAVGGGAGEASCARAVAASARTRGTVHRSRSSMRSLAEGSRTPRARRRGARPLRNERAPSATAESERAHVERALVGDRTYFEEHRVDPAATGRAAPAGARGL